MAALTFPYSTLKARSFRLDLVGQVISGGITATGQQQRVNATGGGLWMLALEFPRFSTASQLRSWRVIQYGSQGGVVPINVAICDLRQAPVPAGASVSSVPHSDDSTFSDGSLYSSPLIVASLAGDIALRATAATIAFDGESVPVGGEYFSLGYGDGYHELHVILSVTETEVAGEYDVTFTPPARAAHTSGEVVTFDHPTLTVVLAQADGMSMATEYGRWGNGQAAFIEYFA